MNLSVRVVLLVAAMVCFILKAVGVSSRVDFMNLGFAFVTASFLFG